MYIIYIYRHWQRWFGIRWKSMFTIFRAVMTLGSFPKTMRGIRFEFNMDSSSIWHASPGGGTQFAPCFSVGYTKGWKRSPDAPYNPSRGQGAIHWVGDTTRDQGPKGFWNLLPYPDTTCCRPSVSLWRSAMGRFMPPSPTTKTSDPKCTQTEEGLENLFPCFWETSESTHHYSLPLRMLVEELDSLRMLPLSGLMSFLSEGKCWLCKKQEVALQNDNLLTLVGTSL